MVKLVALCVAVVAGTLLTLALGVRRAKRSLVFHPSRLPMLERPRALPLGVHYTRVRSALGTAELAVYYRVGWPMIVYTHGTAGNCEDVLYMFEHLDPDWGLVMWDYEGYGRSGGEPSESNTAWDLGAVVDWTCRVFRVRRRELVLWGRSLGTNVTLRYLGQVARPNEWPTCLILVTPFVRISSVLEARVGRQLAVLLGRVVGDMEVAPALAEFCRRGGRTLVLASREDHVTPWVGAEELWRMGHGRVCLQELSGSHQGHYERWELVAEFLTEHGPPREKKRLPAMARTNARDYDQNTGG